MMKKRTESFSEAFFAKQNQRCLTKYWRRGANKGWSEKSQRVFKKLFDIDEVSQEDSNHEIYTT